MDWHKAWTIWVVSTTLFKVLHLNEYFYLQVRLVKLDIQRELGYGGQELHCRKFHLEKKNMLRKMSTWKYMCKSPEHFAGVKYKKHDYTGAYQKKADLRPPYSATFFSKTHDKHSVSLKSLTTDTSILLTVWVLPWKTLRQHFVSALCISLPILSTQPAITL